jgi:hypothetical protein
LSRKIREDPQFIRKLDDYGLSRIPAGTFQELPLEEREYFLGRSNLLFHYNNRFIATFLKDYES